MSIEIKFSCNIDNYKGDVFPRYLQFPPRIGESVSVQRDLRTFYRNKKLPVTLEVVNVIWHEEFVECELWYSKLEIQKAELSGTNLF